MENEDSSTSISEEEEEEEMVHKERVNSESPSNQDKLSDEPIMDEQQSIVDIQQFENDKKAVYKHPLFPLLGN